MKSKLALALVLILVAACSTVPLPAGHGVTAWRGRPHLDPKLEAAWDEPTRAAKQAEFDAEVRAHWSASGAELINDGHGAYLTSNNDFADAEYQLEYRTVAMADSGIYLRANPQVQIWDTTEAGGKWNLGANKGSAGLWNNKRHPRDPLVKADQAFGEWNSMKIRQVGARTWVWLNEHLTVDAVPMENYFEPSLPLPPRGPLQLQTHGGEIRFRNLAVRALDHAEADAALRAQEGDGWAVIAVDATHSAFSGDKQGYGAEGGVLRCKQGSGGNLWTTQSYADFSFRFDFRLPPGGNNGILLRYPGKGDGAYDGFCEVQVLDDGHSKYAGLQAWQMHGSAYGIVPAARGYLRPTGSWNHECITLKGRHLTVELNGTVILDAEVTKPLHDTPHPGLERSSGHIGFGGHGDAVEFRNLAVKELQ